MKITDIIAVPVLEGYTGFAGNGKAYGTVSRAVVSKSLPNPIIEPELRNTDAYMQYRYSIALAAAAAHQGEQEFSQETAWAENIGLVGYVAQDLEQIKAADKRMGVSSVKLSDGGSREEDDVNNTSPVADNSWRKASQ